MNTTQTKVSSTRLKRKFSAQEQHDYCVAWEKSPLNRTTFCKTNDISKSTLYRWYSEFKKNVNNRGFSPLVLEDKAVTIEQDELIRLALNLPNQLQLSLEMPKRHLVSFIQELSYAATIIR